MKREHLLMTLLVVCGLAAGVANAAMIDIPTDGNDVNWRDDGTSIWVNQASASVGMDSTYRDMVHVMPFALPDLGGETILSANLLMHAVDSEWGVGLSLDVYGLRVDASSLTAATDHYVGPWDISGTNGAPIMQAFATKVQGNPAPDNERNAETDAAGDAALAAWLTSLYTAGAQPGDFVFLRVNPDTDNEGGSNTYIYFDSGNATTIQGNGRTYVQVPLLTIETTPEPASLCLLALGGLVAIRKRRA